MKLCFQIVNVSIPNSPSNTIIFGIFEASDSVTNLKIATERFGCQVKPRETYVGVRVYTWFKQCMYTHLLHPHVMYTLFRNRTIRVFYSGEYMSF